MLEFVRAVALQKRDGFDRAQPVSPGGEPAERALDGRAGQLVKLRRGPGGCRQASARTQSGNAQLAPTGTAARPRTIATGRFDSDSTFRETLPRRALARAP